MDRYDAQTITLFEMMRNHEWDNFLMELDKDQTDVINAKDLIGNYFLTYAVQYNEVKIVELLLQKGAKYDIVDKFGRSVLYHAINGNYIDVVKILLQQSIEDVGIMITDIRDNNNNIPLHYAIKNDNIDIANMLITHSNLYTTDKYGNNSLHLAVLQNSEPIVTKVIQHMTNLDLKNDNGENALHLALNRKYNVISKILLDMGSNPNTQNTNNDFSPLHYAVGWDNCEMVRYLISKKANVNIQDAYGNIPLVYSIREDNESCFNELIQHPHIDVNKWNIYGKLPLHEALDRYDVTNPNTTYIDKLIDKSNLSFQDSFGNTCLHSLIAFGIWEKYVHVLKQTKINIFAKNLDGIHVFDLIDEHCAPTSRAKLMQIVVNSYVNLLKKSNNWENEMDMICSKNFGNLGEDDKKKIGIKKPDNVAEFKLACHDIILRKLEKHIQLVKKGKLDYCQRSFPYNSSNDINYGPDKIVPMCTFTGSLLDVLVGLIYLIKKHKNACTIIEKIKQPNKKLCEFYKTTGLVLNNRCEFMNFEIIWLHSKLYMSDNFADLFAKCLQHNAHFIIIPLGIELKQGCHSNFLIYDTRLKELERFEPHGGTTPIGYNYNAHILDDIVQSYFVNMDNNIKYIRPHEYIPKIGFETIDSQETRHGRICDPGGFCALWSIWYTDQRLTYHDRKRDDLVNDLFESIKMSNIGFKNMIRNYSGRIVEQRDKLLDQANIDINDWVNDNLTTYQANKFAEILTNELNNCCVYDKLS